MRYNHCIAIFRIIYIILFKKLSDIAIMHVLAHTLSVITISEILLYIEYENI